MSPCCGKSLSDLSPSNKMLNVQFFHKFCHVSRCFITRDISHMEQWIWLAVFRFQPFFFCLASASPWVWKEFLVLKLYPKSFHFNKFFCWSLHCCTEFAGYGSPSKSWQISDFYLARLSRVYPMFLISNFLALWPLSSDLWPGPMPVTTLRYSIHDQHHHYH